ncbi:MAG: heptosyltransferase [Verrucomicrobiota bacterium]
MVVRGGAIGDFILTLPAIRALRDVFPKAELDILANRQVAPIALDAVNIRELAFLDDPAFAIFFASEKGANGDYFRRYDLVISYLHDPERIFEANVRAGGVDHFLVGPSKIGDGSHATEQLVQPLREFGIQVTDFAPRLKIGAAARRQAQGRLGAPSLIAIHPGSGSARKNWPIANWICLISDLLDRGVQITLVGGEADREQIAALREQFRNDSLSLAIDWPLRDLAALMAGTIFIGHDSGISHLAAASGARSLLLFGPTDPRIWAPRNDNARVLLAPDGDLNQLSAAIVCESVDQELMRIGIRT